MSLQSLSSELAQLLREHGITNLGLTFANEEVSMSDLRRMSESGLDSFLDSMKYYQVEITDAKILYNALQRPGAADEPAGLLTAEMTEEVKSVAALLAAAGRAQQQQHQQQKPTNSVFQSDALAAALGSVAATTTPRIQEAPAKKSAAQIRKEQGSFATSSLSYESWKAGVDPSTVKRTNAALAAYQSRQTTEERREAETSMNAAAHKGTLIVAPDNRNNNKIVNINKNNVGSWFV